MVRGRRRWSSLVGNNGLLKRNWFQKMFTYFKYNIEYLEQVFNYCLGPCRLDLKYFLFFLHSHTARPNIGNDANTELQMEPSKTSSASIFGQWTSSPHLIPSTFCIVYALAWGISIYLPHDKVLRVLIILPNLKHWNAPSHDIWSNALNMVPGLRNRTAPCSKHYGGPEGQDRTHKHYVLPTTIIVCGDTHFCLVYRIINLNNNVYVV